MRHSIKVDNHNYQKLQEAQLPRESYNDVVTRLFRVYDAIYEVRETLGPGHYLMEKPSTDAREEETAHR